MPAARVGDSAVVKLVGYNPTNPQRIELPTIVSTLTLYDLATGHLKALCDGTFLTAVRTGAASALASEVLADPDSEVIGLIGCGAQAVTQLHALTRLFPVKTVLAYDILPSVAATLRRRVSFLGIDVAVCAREELEREAQIICTATSVGQGHGPVIADDTLRPDVHINAVGSDMPGKTELPLALLQRSLVCPDYTPQAILEGECQQLRNGHIGPSLSEIIKRAPEFWKYRRQSTVFDSTGFALEDLVAMEVLLGHARRLGVGQSQQIEGLGYDALDPYSFVTDN
jgi:ornithine cyclodeaminase